MEGGESEHSQFLGQDMGAWHWEWVEEVIVVRSILAWRGPHSDSKSQFLSVYSISLIQTPGKMADTGFSPPGAHTRICRETTRERASFSGKLFEGSNYFNQRRRSQL